MVCIYLHFLSEKQHFSKFIFSRFILASVLFFTALSRLYHGFAGAHSAADFSGFARGSRAGYYPCSTRYYRTFSRLSRGFKGSEVYRHFTFVRPLFDSVFERQKWGILAAFSPLSFNSACLLSVCSKQSIFLIIPPFSLNLVENAASTNLCKKAIPCVMYKVAKPRLRDRSLQV